MNILADAHIPYLRGVAEQFGHMEYLSGNEFSKETIKDKDALIVRTVTRFDEKILAGSKVKLICSATIGYDHIDTDYCDANGIAWRTAPGCNASSVEQYVTASLLFLAEKFDFKLNEKTIGIVGVGNVGTKVAAACEKLGMRVLLNDPPREEAERLLGEGEKRRLGERETGREGDDVRGEEGGWERTDFVDLETIKREADIITFHTPLTKTGKHKTYHLANEHFFNTLQKKPFIINSSRGSVVDNMALKSALKKDKVSGAAIDCWENEPDIDPELLEIAEIATPHIAGYSADGKWMATKMSIENLKVFFQSSITPEFQLLPPPLHPIINLQDVEPEKQFAHAVWHTYNPMKETVELKSAPEKFYWFRSNYPLRREYKAYTIVNASPDVSEMLQKLGFNLQ